MRSDYQKKQMLDKVNIDTFSTEYLDLKRKGVVDKDICEMYYINLHDMYYIKKYLGLTNVRVRRKTNSLSEEELRTAMLNGIPRRIALRRKSELGWPNHLCITEPLKKGSRKVKILMMLKEKGYEI
jgi:hypothetical protein